MSDALFSSLKSGGKAELALDLLDIEDPKALKPPAYIRDGLLWLSRQLRRNQQELGLAVTVITADDESKEAK